ncbi:MAG: hypothetical protein WCO86_14775 [Planctomycetota bacterium]
MAGSKLLWSHHNDRRGGRCIDNPAGVIKLIASNVRFPAIPAICKRRSPESGGFWKSGDRYFNTVLNSGLTDLSQL